MSIRIYVLLFCSMLAVSTSPLIARYLHNLDPIAISFWRMLLGAIILNIYAVSSNNFHSISSENHFKTILSGILLGIHFALFYAL